MRQAFSSGESADAAHWRGRQTALGIELHGETLEPDEVMFCERFLRVHQGIMPSDVMEWIAKDQYAARGYRLPTNDFVGLARNREQWEQKTPSRRPGGKTVYDRIKQRIRDDLRKGKTRS